jgi:transposase, IS30 family
MKYKHLTEEERYQIYELKCEGFSKRKIAKKLCRSPSTLSREFNRNQGERGWRPKQAQMKSIERLAARGFNNAKKVSEEAWNDAVKHLTEDQWSPDQISGKAKLDGLPAISHETIYQRILEDKNSGGELYTHLRCKKKRKKRYGSNRSTRGSIPNRIDIDQRPKIVESRKRVGDWEGDTIIGSHTKGAVIVSMVERKTRFTLLAKSKNKTTTSVINEITRKMKPISDFVFTITLDNGKEFASHEKFTEALGANVYFAKPYHSWERGLNENTNGLVRQYFPKKKSFDNITEQDLQSVVNKLNHRPRKCLGYQTPFEVFSKSCQKRSVALRV